MDEERKLQLKLEVVLRQLTHPRQQGLRVLLFYHVSFWLDILREKFLGRNSTAMVISLILKSHYIKLKTFI